MSYKTQIETLLRVAADLEAKSRSIEEGFGYHNDQLMLGRTKMVQLGEQANAARDAAATLALMDKAGMTMKVPA